MEGNKNAYDPPVAHSVPFSTHTHALTVRCPSGCSVLDIGTKNILMIITSQYQIAIFSDCRHQLGRAAHEPSNEQWQRTRAF